MVPKRLPVALPAFMGCFMKEKLKNLRARAMVAALAAGPALAMAADPTDPNAALGEAKTTVLAIVATGGAAFIAIALAGVGWNVGAKFIKRLGSKA